MEKLIAKALVWGLALVLVFVSVAGAQTVRVLPTEEAVRWGASHAVTLTHGDLTTTNVNTAQAFDVAVLAKQGVEVAAYVLEIPFQDVATNANNTLTLTIGDGTTADLLLSSTEMCVDGTEVFLKPGGGVYNSGTSTNVTLVARQKVYTADGVVRFTVTPHASYGVAAMDTGRVTVYLKIWDALKRN